MAGNNSIQILRGKSDTFDQTSCEEILADGQPFFDTKLKHFYIGDGTSKVCELDTVHPDYAEKCLSENEVLLLWKNATGGTV